MCFYHLETRRYHVFFSKNFIKVALFGEISDPHGDEDEDDCLLGCCAV
jgi:hypothetical protein